MNLYHKKIFPVFIITILLTGLTFVVSAEAVTWADQPLLPWEEATLRSFDKNDYDKVIDLAKEQQNDPNDNAPLFIYFSHAQKYYLEKNRASAIYYKQQYNMMTTRLSGSNLAVLTRLVAMPQTSWNKKINDKFLDAAFTKDGNEKYLGAVLYYLISLDPVVAKAAINGLRSILQHKRQIVMNGGTLSHSDRVWMSDERLIKLLVRKTGESVNPMAGFMSKLPAFARKKAVGGASACLALIEDPALQLLQEAATMGNANAASTIQLIHDARGARLARYPGSTWYSATGR
jgi:hypothetical protein